MRTQLTAVLVLMLAHSSSFAAAKKSDIADLKADLGNYANSDCKEERYILSAMRILAKINGSFSAPISKDVTKEQAAQMDVMRSKTDIISAVMAPKLGPDPCKVKMEKAIKQLDTVPTDEASGLQPARPAAPSSGTN